jgi:FeS assembly SUF system protein
MSDGASRQLEMNLDAPAADEAAVDPFTQELIDQLKTVFDPEIPVDIYELGLIYKIDVADNKDVSIDMTLTAPACPVAGEMPGWVKDAVARVPGVGEVTVNMVFDPPWTPERMSEAARLELNMF